MAADVQDPPKSTDDIESVGKIPPDLVQPPKDIRAVVEKTAGYVARNGPVFEDRIRQKELNNPKFSFLNSLDAYNPFYLWRLNEIKEGRGTLVSAGHSADFTTASAKLPSKPQGPEPPPEYQFSARLPNISALDLAVVKLTAAFAAKRGKVWLNSLFQKEAGSHQFDFLRPQHGLHQFFCRMQDQYSDLLTSSTSNDGSRQKQRINQLTQNVKNHTQILERARKRAEWSKFQEAQKQKKEAEEEAERLAYAQIDWHDFIVVETVLFTPADNDIELPPPTVLSDLQTASLEQKAMLSLAPANMRIEETAPNDDIYEANRPVNEPTSLVPEVHTKTTPQDSAVASRTSDSNVPIRVKTKNDDVDDFEELQIRERMENKERAQKAQAAAKGPSGPIKVRNDYIPRAQLRRPATATALCPNCKQHIPLDEWEAHMRVELLDPNWRAQKALSDQRQSTTNLSTADVANNLKRLASQRSDVFDPITGQNLSDITEEQKRKIIKVGQNEPNNPAGSDSTDNTSYENRKLQGLPIEEQIRQLHRRFSANNNNGQAP